MSIKVKLTALDNYGLARGSVVSAEINVEMCFPNRVLTGVEVSEIRKRIKRCVAEMAFKLPCSDFGPDNIRLS